MIKLGALGDVINTFPLAVHLKENLNCEIHWLVAPLSRPLVEAHPCVDQVIPFDKNNFFESLKRVWPRLRREGYDITLDLQRILKSGLFTLATQSRRKIGFDKKRCKEMTWILPFERIPPANPTAHMLDQYMEFATHLGLPPAERVQWKLPRTDALPPGLPKDFIVLNIGATKKENQWAPEHFATLAQNIDQALGLPCVLTGGPEDRETGKIIEAKTRVNRVNMVGKTNLEELVEVLARAQCTISCDTGPMHLARALGTELIALFGPSNPNRTGPYGGRVIKKGENPLPIPMETIAPKDVMDLLNPILNIKMKDSKGCGKAHA